MAGLVLPGTTYRATKPTSKPSDFLPRPSVPSSGMPGVGGVVLPPTDQQAREAAGRASQENTQQTFDDQWLQARGNLGGGTPSPEAVARLRDIQSLNDVGGGSGARPGTSGGGTTAPAQVGMTERERMELSARLQREAEARRLAEIQKIISGLNTGGPPPLVNNQAAVESIYNRSKEKLALQGRAALDALNSRYASTGNVGANKVGGEGVIGDVNEQLGELVRDQTIKDVDRQDTWAREQNAYNLQKRQQDMSMISALMGLMTARSLY